jgi:hypothetical protein
MGGFGSGRQHGGPCTDDMLALDVRELNRAGLLAPGRSASWQWVRDDRVMAAIGVRAELDRVMLDYRNRNRSARHNGGEWETMHCAVRLDWTPCALGGQRVWWRCPGAGCGRRVAVLYGGRVFACRHCHGLAYRSQRETESDRVRRRAMTSRKRLGWPAGILLNNGGKPKGMHWRTYWRLLDVQNQRVGAALAGLAGEIEHLKQRCR